MFRVHTCERLAKVRLVLRFWFVTHTWETTTSSDTQVRTGRSVSHPLAPLRDTWPQNRLKTTAHENATQVLCSSRHMHS